jgi:8-oxo-dGTP pyrophosphatase MutT (NUDIX family)
VSNPGTQITPLVRVEARVESAEWDFARDQRAEIAAHWAKQVAAKPKMFNGIVLMQHRWTLEDRVYSTAYTPVDFASFLSWIHFGQPGSPRRNGFAMAALQGSDGAFLLGVMGEHTANAGKIYFPGGTPDMNDVTPDGRVDLAASLRRELYEETGLRPDEVEITDSWVLVTETYRAAFLKPARLIYDAATARKLLLERLATQTDQELADFAIVRSPADINGAKTPEFAAAYMRWVFAGSETA